MRMSEAERVLNCPGSVAACEGIPALSTGPNEAANSGTRIHTATGLILHMEGDAYDAMQLTEREDFCARWFARTVQDVELATPNWQSAVEEMPITIPGVGTGHPDRVAFYPDKLLVFEYKSGANGALPAAQNVQCRMYIAALWLKYGLPIELHVLAVGNDRGEWHTACTFDADACKVAVIEAQAIAARAALPDAPRSTGDHCTYCRARGTHRCPESLNCVAVIKRDFREELLAHPDELARWAHAAKEAKAIADKILQALEYALSNNVSVPGWTLHEGRKRREIADIVAAWGWASQYMTQDAFLRLCSVGLTALEDAVYASHRKDMTRKEVQLRMEHCLTEANAMTVSKTKPYAVETKEVTP